MHVHFYTSHRLNHGASPKESSDAQRKKIPRLSKEALRHLKFINSFLCDFFFNFWTEDSLKKYFSVAFSSGNDESAIREEQMAGGGLCRSQRAIVTVQRLSPLFLPGAHFNSPMRLEPTFAHGAFSACHSNKRCPHSTRQRSSGRSDAVIFNLPKGMSLLYFYFFNIYWSIVDLQHRVSFRYTAQWISLVYLYTFIPSFPDSFPI